jgi:23S rRNA pseudouridine2605 synthase
MVCEPSYDINPATDEVYLEGVSIKAKKYEYIMLNKPRGVTTTKKDRFAESTVMDLLPKEFSHLYPVGRLDKDTQGLLVLTNNGILANMLMHPKFEVDKVYVVQIGGSLKENDKVRLQQGIILEGRRTSQCRINKVSFNHNKTSFEITLHEGRKRQIRLMLQKLSYPVLDLKRIKEGPLLLGDLPIGKWRRLKEEEIKELKSLTKGRGNEKDI